MMSATTRYIRHIIHFICFFSELRVALSCGPDPAEDLHTWSKDKSPAPELWFDLLHGEFSRNRRHGRFFFFRACNLDPRTWPLDTFSACEFLARRKKREEMLDPRLSILWEGDFCCGHFQLGCPATTLSPLGCEATTLSILQLADHKSREHESCGATRCLYSSRGVLLVHEKEGGEPREAGSVSERAMGVPYDYGCVFLRVQQPRMVLPLGFP